MQSPLSQARRGLADEKKWASGFKESYRGRIGICVPHIGVNLYTGREREREKMYECVQKERNYEVVEGVDP